MASRDRMATSTPSGLRLLSASLICLLLAGNLPIWLHQVTTRHTPCYEHGGLIHVGPPDHSTERPATAFISEDGPRAWWGATPPSRAGDQHQHCPVCLTTRTRQAIVEPTGAQQAEVTALRLDAPTEAVAGPPGVAVYRIAPKHSPPLGPDRQPHPELVA